MSGEKVRLCICLRARILNAGKHGGLDLGMGRGQATEIRHRTQGTPRPSKFPLLCGRYGCDWVSHGSLLGSRGLARPGLLR
jgi:hypothetical protein